MAGTAVQIAVDVKMGDYEQAGVKLAAEGVFGALGAVTKTAVDKINVDKSAKELLKIKTEIPIESAKKGVDKVIENKYDNTKQ